jgi:hypothetical protein
MGSSGESIREQLLKLLKKERASPTTPAPQESPPSRAKVIRHQETQPSASSEIRDWEDWKKGVKPLRHDPASTYFDATSARKSKPPRPEKPDPSIARPPGRSLSRPIESAASRPATAKTPLHGDSGIPEPSLSTERNYCDPEGWVAAGRSLQIGAEGSRVLPIRIGLDFGTAYSKLAIRVAGKVFLVDWSGVHRGSRSFVLAGEVSTLPDGRCVPGRAPGAKSCVTNLKLPFLELDRLVGPGDLARATTFVAWMLVYARAWLYRHQSSLLQGNQLIWELNLGAPTGSWTQGPALRDRYKKVAMAAWRLSQEDDVSITRAVELIETSAPASSGYGLDALAILPEFAAQIAGYVKSPQRINGLHLLVDVGAGTLDVACFRIMRTGTTFQDRFPVFSSEVEPLGTHYLMQARLAGCGVGIDRWQSTSDVPTCGEFARENDVDVKSAEAVDKKFSQLCGTVVSRVLSWTRYRMDRRAEEWKAGLPVFLAGGGAQVGVYRVGVDKAFTGLGIPYTFRRFPVPRDVDVRREQLTTELVGRTSVAYGLTFDADEIGELIPPSDIPPDYDPPTRERPDRDELYPK